MKITDKVEVYAPEYISLKEIMEQHEREHWLPEEAVMKEDVEQWKNGTLLDTEKEFIKMILRLFTQADTNVAGGYVEKLLPVFKHPDARMMLLSFASREATHIHAYRRLNETLGYDSQSFMEEFLGFKEMSEKHEFMVESANLSKVSGVAEYLAKQILMEGVNLFASFAMLLNYSRSGLLPGMVSVNKWSIIDESLHVEGLTRLFKIYINEHPTIVNDKFKKEIYETARKVVQLEDAFIDLCFSIGSTRKLEKDEVKQYIRYVCDHRMKQMGLKEQFGVTKNPLEWVDKIAGDTFGNFFEVTITNYSKSNLSGEWAY